MHTMMLKTAALLFAVILLISLPACSKKDNTGKPQGEYDQSGQYTPSVPDVSKAFEDARKQNTDVVAWLQLPNTKIDEAVVQTTNNEFYLRRDVKKNYSYEGCYYMDYESVMFEGGKDLARNTIIYGHNLGSPLGVKDDFNGVKFAQLLKLTDIELAKNTPYIYLTTESGNHIFEIFTVMYCEAVTKPVQYHYADYSDEQFNLLISDVKARSLYQYDVNVTTEDKILTLSTCTYKYGTYSQNPHQRFVVMGRLVRKDEGYHETAPLTVNENPKAPSF
ncbi:class B sortase [Oscillospiraceae bacterium PP1C4]